MKTKLLFLLVFVPVHALLSLNALHYAFNPPSGGHSALSKLWVPTITSPVLLPLVMYDPDGERLPEWIQFVSVPLNSLVWGIAFLLAFGLIKRCCASHRRG